MTERSEVLELVSGIREFVALEEFLQDKDVERALYLVVKLITKIEESSPNIPRLIVELQAISAKCSTLGVYYATISRDKAGTPNNYRKNIYYNLRDSLDRLVDSLKYLARANV